MNKKLTAALSGSAVVLMALSACSDSDSKVNAWAKQVCDRVQPQLKKISDANTSIQQAGSDNSTPADVQRTDAAAFQNISEAYKALASAVNGAGAPPVSDGQKTQQAAVDELNSTAASYAGLNAKINALDTKNQAKFADGLNGVATELGGLSKNGDDALQKLQSGDLGQAMAKQAGCRKTAPSAASSASSS